MTAERTLIVADPAFSLAEDRPCPDAEALVTWAKAAGSDRLAVRAFAGTEGWAVVRPAVGAGTGTPPSLEEVMLAAHRVGIGLVVRIAETDVLDGLAGALGIMGADGPATLRRRYLVVVPTSRIGKRLRQEAPDLPSAREIVTGSGLRGAFHRATPNLARAASDADDLVVPAGTFGPSKIRDALVPQLRRRGAFVWVADVAPEERSAYEDLGAGGLLLRLPWSG